MLQLPQSVFEKLVCVKCQGYLNCAPITVKDDDQLCGRCFTLLPETEQQFWARQKGLEAIAEITTFPCKYQSQGCNYTYCFNVNSSKHETDCPHQGSSLVISNNNNTTRNNAYIYESKELEMTINCVSTFPDSEDKIKINVEIRGKNGHALALDQRRNLTVGMEMVVTADISPEIKYGHVLIQPETEPVYYNVKYVSGVKCAECHRYLQNTQIYHCPFGHSLCKLCKVHPCILCGAEVMSSSRHYCKNYNKGCTDLVPSHDITRHEKDCEFNDFTCPLCNHVGALTDVTSHFLQNHEAIHSNELQAILGKKDRQWFLYCYDKLFQCNCYNFDDTIEVFVVYCGANDKASNFKYEIMLVSDSFKNMKKSAKCLGRNEVSLGQVVSFHVGHELRKNMQVRIVIT